MILKVKNVYVIFDMFFSVTSNTFLHCETVFLFYGVVFNKGILFNCWAAFSLAK